MRKYLFLILFFSLNLLVNSAKADEWGCQVLLCLANPNGPTAVGECVPPITRLWNALRKRNPDPFPTCDMAQNTATGKRSFAELGNNYYDPCPAGTTELQQGTKAVMGNEVPRVNYFGIQDTPPTYFTGIGSGAGLYPTADVPLGLKTCVAGYMGDWTYRYQVREYDQDVGYSWWREDENTVSVYQRIVFVDPANSPNLINVYVDESLYRVVRY